MVNQIYPTKFFTNDQGPKEITTWDVYDSTGFICIVAFNNHSVAMKDEFQMNKVIDVEDLTDSLHQ